MSAMNLKEKLNQSAFSVVSEAAEDLNVKCFVIGGFVRDLLLGRPCKDLDFTVEGDGIALAKAVAQKCGNPKVSIFKNFGTASLHFKDSDLEFVGARKESYNRDSRNPKVENGTIEDDQKRRDFTINALGISLNKGNFGELSDPFGGIEDLNNKIIKTPLNPDITFSDDPLRMMRAIRFATQLNFSIDETALNAIAGNKGRIKIVSQERITDELNKIILSPIPSIGFKLLFNSGLLSIIFPQMQRLQGVEIIDGKGHKDNFYHTLQVLDNVSKNTNDLWLRWAAILHDIAKPATKRFEKGNGWTFHGHEDRGARMVPKIFQALKLPLGSEMHYVQKLVKLHLRPIALTSSAVTDSACRRLLFDVGDDLEDLMLLCDADITSKNEKKVKRFQQNFKKVKQRILEVEEKDRIKNWQPPVSGQEIMETLNLKPSREVGIIKDAIKDAVLDGIIESSHEAALQFMTKKALEMGLINVVKEKK